MRPIHSERHRSDNSGWLRAAVLGANDGILSVGGLLVGVASSGAAAADVPATGIAGLVAGTMSMAAGEYVSVQSQADTERADLALERRELHDHPQSELEELAAIYCQRGLDAGLARQVAEQLTAQDALEHMHATNSASPRACARDRCRPRWRRQRHSAAARHFRFWPRCWRRPLERYR